MVLPILPPKYYLDHFFELIDVLEEYYQPVLEPTHKEFLADFRNLSEDAQCLYVRMLNRKGQIFSLKSFDKYQEITGVNKGLRELLLKNFISGLKEEFKDLLPEFLTKAELRKWLLKSGYEVKTSWSREEMSAFARSQLQSLRIESLASSENLVVQGKTQELQYLFFLYFGKIQKTLSLYTLRDLGIRKASKLKSEFKPRYTELRVAQIEYQLMSRLDSFSSLDEEGQVKEFLEYGLALKDINPAALGLKDQLLLSIANFAESQNPEMALNALGSCGAPTAKERQARLLFKLDRKEECRALLEATIQDPVSDEDLLFAEDFLARKYNKKRVGYLTEILQNSQELTLSDFYLRKPERGVRDYYRKQGLSSHFTENHLWTGIFGLLFWEELFENEKTAIYNPFERSPNDLVGPEFYQTHKNEVEAKLELLLNPKTLESHLLKMVTQHYGKRNDIFQWHPGLLTTILEFVRASTGKNLGLIFRTMAQNFSTYHSGYPDLMVVKEEEPFFVEVKAEGDSLRSKQLSKVRLLIEAGFQVEILRVKWKTDPNQIYVVVDVETTGGSSGFHRCTEIGAVKVQNGQIIDEFQTLLNPGRPIPKNITLITGITDEMVAHAPVFGEIAQDFEEFTRGAIFVAHNVRFDYGFIQREFQRLDLNFVRPQMCTVASMRKYFPGLVSYSLKNLTNHFSISLQQHHRALCDAKAAAHLLMMINQKRCGEAPSSAKPQLETCIDRDFEI